MHKLFIYCCILCNRYKGTEVNTSKALTSGSIVDIIVYVKKYLLGICIYVIVTVCIIYMSLTDTSPTPENLEWIIET
jgi:hypothetical protein